MKKKFSYFLSMCFGRAGISPLILIALILVLTNSCKKDEYSVSGIIFNPAVTYGTLTDIDGNVYKTVKIGTQTWMAENLKVTKYRNGATIPIITDGNQWEGMTSGAYSEYSNNSINGSVYGKLYNWYAVSDSNNLAPTGWHVPTSAEWTTLKNFLGGDSVAAGKLKEIGTSHWKGPNTGATNETGFTALPAGCRPILNWGAYENVGNEGYWWSSSLSITSYPVYQDISYNSSKVQSYSSIRKTAGYSIRCVKD
jgi:uncharacterized protein (TIGR02145 family)